MDMEMGLRVVENRKRKGVYNRRDVDRISSLPNHLIHHILEYLPLYHVAKTSFMSKVWKNIWLMHPKLIFDCEFYRNLFCGKEATQSKFVTTISTILSLHKGFILHFALAIPLGYHCPLGLWIQQVSRKGVKIMNLDNYLNSTARSVSFSLFLCLDLTHLKLQNWILSPPIKSASFANLIEVSLSSVVITAPISFGTKLEVLDMLCCRGIEHLGSQFRRDNNLRRLHIIRCTQFVWQWLKLTTKLESLCLYLVPADSNKKEFINLVKLLTHNPNCHTLLLNGPTLQFLLTTRSILTRLTTKVVSLKVLTLGLQLCNYYHISSALCLIRSCPHLQYLRISPEVRVKNVNHMELTNEDYLGLLDQKDLLLDRLQTVEIQSVVNRGSVICAPSHKTFACNLAFS